MTLAPSATRVSPAVLLKRLLGKDDRFYDLLEAAAREMEKIVGLLTEAGQELAAARPITDEFFKRDERRDKLVFQQITELLCRTFITPLEREDIETLANGLARIPKSVRKILALLTILPPDFPGQTHFLRQMELLGQSAAEVGVLVGFLRGRVGPTRAREHLDRIKALEAEADRLLHLQTRALYAAHIPGRDLVLLKDLFELIEKAVDRSRDAANQAFQVILKNS